MKKAAIIGILILFVSQLNASILSDLTKDREITIQLIPDKPVQEEPTDDKPFGNRWYSRKNLYIFQNVEMGMSGTKDFLSETFLIKYRFKSKNKHAFAMKFFHNGYSPGIFTNHFDFYNFSVLTGFEYLFKVFGPTSGIFVWSDIGGCNGGFAFDIGVGIGDRVKDGIELWISYLQGVGFFSRLDFYFLVIDVLIIRGRFGLDIKQNGLSIDVFNFLTGLYMGFSIRDTFRMEMGGGITINDYFAISGFGGIGISFNIF